LDLDVPEEETGGEEYEVLVIESIIKCDKAPIISNG